MNYSVRTFRAPSMREALAAVKRELGSDAIILGTRSLPQGNVGAWMRRERVEISAAPPGQYSPAPRLKGGDDRTGATTAARSSASGTGARPGTPTTAEPARPTPDKPALPKHLYPYYVQLIQNDVAQELAERLVRQATAQLPEPDTRNDDVLRAAVRQYIARMIPASAGVELPPEHHRRVALVGPSGSGKTTTLAKLAALFRVRHDKRVALLSLDMHRIGAHDQLRHYAEALDIPLHTAQTIAGVKQALASLDSIDLLLIDTPGVGPREQARFARLATLLRAARPDEIHLVLPASMSPNVQTRVAQGLAPLGVSKLVLTRLDDVVGLGVILNVVERLKLGLSYLSAGQNVPGDLQEASGERVADQLCAANAAVCGAEVLQT